MGAVSEGVSASQVRCAWCAAEFAAEPATPGAYTAPCPRCRRAVPRPGAPEPLPDPRLGTRLGQFRILAGLGAGGSANVYEAEDEILKRRVAVKLLPAESVGGSEEAARRFLHEARSACRLDHPNIVTVYHVGHDAGTYYIAMQLVRGGSAADFVRRHGPMSPADATRVVVEVAKALSAAHAVGVVHRDIKPANIMLGPAWTVKVTDFGIAKTDGPEDADASGGRLLGTPSYMPPEAWRGQPVDGRSDLYSLGATWYCLLAGRPPFRGETPGGIMGAHLGEPVPDPRAVRPDIPPEVFAALQRALAKDPADRYQTADEMIAELSAIDFSGAAADSAAGAEMQDWAALVAATQAAASPAAPAPIGQGEGSGSQRGSAVRAAPSGKLRTAPLSGQNRRPGGASGGPPSSPPSSLPSTLIAAGALGAAAVVGIAAAVWVMGRGAPPADPPPAKPTVPDPAVVRPPDPEPVPPDPDPFPLETGQTPVADPVPVDPVMEQFVRESTAAWQAANRGDKAALDAALVQLRAFAAKYANAPEERHRTASVQALAEAEKLGGDPDYREAVATWPPVHDNEILALAVSPDGKTVASAGRDDKLFLWGVEGRKPLPLEGHNGDVTCVVFGPDGRSPISGGSDGRLVFHDPTAKSFTALRADIGPVRSLALSPDGKVLAAGGASGVRFWSLPDRRELGHHRTREPVSAVLFAADGKAAAAAGSLVFVLDPTTGKSAGLPLPAGGEVLSAALSPDGRMLALGTGAGLRVLEWPSRKAVFEQADAPGRVLGLAFSRDGRTLAVASDDETVRLLDAAAGRQLAACRGHMQAVNAVAFLSEGRTMITAGADGTLKTWDASRPPDPVPLPGHVGVAGAATIAPDGRWAATVDLKAVRIWNLPTGRLRHTLALQNDSKGRPRLVFATAASPDSRLLAVGGRDREVRLFDAVTGRERSALPGMTEMVRSLAFSPDGRTLATGHFGTESGVVRLWNLETQKPVRELKAHAGSVTSMVFADEGKYLISGSDDATVRIWNLAADPKAEPPVLKGHTRAVRRVALSPDGRTLATASFDGTVRLWDVRTGKEQAVLGRHVGPVWSVAFGPEGKTLVTGGADKTVRVWSTASQRQRELFAQPAPVSDVRVTPDGRAVLATGGEGLAVLIPLPAERPVKRRKTSE
jgi:WD40 repeat protein/tRNA A-37 threonylcarbamoyl transferase component Bud32